MRESVVRSHEMLLPPSSIVGSSDIPKPASQPTASSDFTYASASALLAMKSMLRTPPSPRGFLPENSPTMLLGRGHWAGQGEAGSTTTAPVPLFWPGSVVPGSVVPGSVGGAMGAAQPVRASAAESTS